MNQLSITGYSTYKTHIKVSKRHKINFLRLKINFPKKLNLEICQLYILYIFNVIFLKTSQKILFCIFCLFSHVDFNNSSIIHLCTCIVENFIYRKIASFTYTWRLFKFVLFENKISNEKILFCFELIFSHRIYSLFHYTILCIIVIYK